MHTNSTSYYNLPQFVDTDIVNDLTDTNGAYQTIDSTMHDIASAIGTDSADIAQLQAQNGDAVLTTTAQTLSGAVNELDDDLNNATTGAFALIAGNTADIGVIENTIGDANSGMIKDIGQLQTTVGSQGLSIGSIEVDVAALQGSMVSVKADVSDIKTALGNETLITTAQTVTGAINEIAGAGVQAGNVSYDNTDSGLSATNVQGAVDEVNESAVKLLSATSTGTTLNTTITAGNNYTAPEDALYLLYARSTGTSSAAWSLNNVEILTSASGESEMLVPLKKDAVISTKAVGASGDTYTYLVKTYFQF